MKKILILFISTMLLCCGENEVSPIVMPSETEAALRGEWIINVIKIDTNAAGLGDGKIRLGRYEAQISVDNGKNPFKALVWKSQMYPGQFTAMIQGNNFIANNGSNLLVGVFSHINSWTGAYTVYRKGNTGFRATFTATRKF